MNLKIILFLKKLFTKDITLKNKIGNINAKQTKEAKFAYFCDKLECDLQSKIYDEEGCVDLNNQENNNSAKDKDVKEMLENGYSFSKMWQTFGLKKYNYDDNFANVSKYAMGVDILRESKDKQK